MATLTKEQILHPIYKLHEDHGHVLLWPANGDPPEVGHCLDNDFDPTEWEYFSLIPDVKNPEEIRQLELKAIDDYYDDLEKRGFK